MFRTTIAVSILAFALSGCDFFGKSDVSCNDDSTKKLVKDIFIDGIKKSLRLVNLGGPKVEAAVTEKLSVSVDNVLTDSIDGKINKYTCQADLSISYPMNGFRALSPIFDNNDIMGLTKGMFSFLPILAASNGLISIKESGVQAPEAPIQITKNGLHAPHLSIQYTSQSTDDGRQYVKITKILGDDPDVIVALLASIIGVSEYNESAASAAAPVAPAPQASPEAAPAAPAEEVAVPNARPNDSAESELVHVGPSFDCAKAGTQIEKLICATPAISALDLRMSEVYKQLLSVSENPADLKKEQIAWINEKRNTCKSVKCLETAYQSRIDELESLLYYYSKPAEFR